MSLFCLIYSPAKRNYSRDELGVKVKEKVLQVKTTIAQMFDTEF